MVASYGSYVTLLSTLFFFYIVYVSLISQKFCSNYPWDFNNNQAKTFPTLEWAITSPPAYHTFEEMPLICETIKYKHDFT